MFKLSDTYTFDAPRDELWPLIFDPQSLLNMIPGCEQIEQVSPTEYKSVIKINIAGISGNYQVYIKILETDQPRFCRMQGEVDGPTGAIKGEADFELEPVGEKTELAYHGNALITGALGKLNPRFFEGVAKSLIKQGLDKLNKQVKQTSQEK